MWQSPDGPGGGDEPPKEPVVIPFHELSPDALRGVIESFVLREGTEYGARDFSLEQKVAHVMAQLERRDVHIVYDPNSQSVDIMTAAKSAARGAPPSA